MSEINVISRTQIINVEPTSSAVSVINAGPAGPGGAIGSATGSVILPGTGPPLPSDGAVGNYWIDTVHGILYGPKKTVAPVWPVAMYGAQTPPALLGENRVTSLAYSSNLLPVNIDLPVITRIKAYLHLNLGIQGGASYAFECRIDGTVVGRFGYPHIQGINEFAHGTVIVPNVSAGQHTVSVFPLRVTGSGNCVFQVTPQLPAYLSVYKDRA